MADQDYDETQEDDVTILFIFLSALVIFIYAAIVKLFRETFGMNVDSNMIVLN